MFGCFLLSGGLLSGGLVGCDLVGGAGFKGTQRLGHFGRNVRVRVVEHDALRSGRVRLAQQRGDVHRLFVDGIAVRSERFGEVAVVFLRRIYHVRDLRLRVVVAHLDDLRGERIDVRQPRIHRVELAHDLVDHVGRPAEQAHTFRRQRLAGGAQALEQAFQRRQQPGQQRDVDHRDRAVQGMHRTQQLLADRKLAVGALDGGTYGLQVLRHFAAQDFQQHRIHRRHHRQLHRRFGGIRFGCRRDRGHVGVGQAGLGYLVRFDTDARHASDHLARDRFGGTRRLCGQARLLARRQLPGDLHDGAERHVWRGFALERRQQLGQRADGVVHDVLHVLGRLDGVVEHAVEHVLHFPGKLAQHPGADQAAGSLQRVERAADADQRRCLRRIRQPVGFGRGEVVDFLLHFLEEDLADIVVDALGVGVETGVGGERVGYRHLLDHLFLDLDPVLVQPVGRDAVGRGRSGFGQAQAGDVMLRRGWR